MGKLTRFTQLIFGSSAGSNQIAQFGSLAAGSPTLYSPTTANLPSLIQALANFVDGWFSAVIGANSPAIEDMNSLFYLLTYQLAYLMQEGVPEWDSGTSYYTGSLCMSAGILYVSLIDNNLNNALGDVSAWRLLNGNVRTVTANTTLLASDNLVRSNSTSGSLTHTLPAIASTPVGTRISVKDVGTGGYTTEVQGSGSDLIDGNNLFSKALAEYDSATFFNNGASWDVI